MKESLVLIFSGSIILISAQTIRLFSDKSFRFPDVFAAFPGSGEAALADGVSEGIEALKAIK